jgi:predicted nucleic acid-binding protein
MYLFDTDALSNVVKKKPSDFLIRKLQNLPKEVQYTTAINIGEIYYGANKSSHRDIILKAFETRVFPHINILPFDEKSAKIFGELKARIEKKGITRSEPDLRIAAIAIQHQLIVITGNTRHFEGIQGVAVENWIQQ